MEQSQEKEIALRLKTYRLGFKPQSALCLGVVRHLPRGVKKKDHGRYFDIWFPLLAPSKGVVKSYMNTKDWKSFARRYKVEMDRAEARSAVKLLSEVARRTPIAIGCYCLDEKSCHRSILKELIKKEARG